MSRVVAGTLLLPNGQPMANASIYFTAKRTEPVSIIEGSNTFFTTNNAGVYNQSVVNGFYAVSIEYIADASGAYTRRWQLGDVFIETGAPSTLEALIIASNVPDDIALGVFYEILEEAQAAAASASASAAAAAASAASIIIGTGPTEIPNTTILNSRLGTAGNLGTAAQQNSDSFASSAQGAKADSAIQTAALNDRLGTAGNLGTAAQQNSDAFATAAQGTKADSAIQTPALNTRLGTVGNLGTAAQQNSDAFATAAQGVKADSAIQTAVLNTRLGTTGNLGNAAQATATTSSTDTTVGRVAIVRSDGFFGIGNTGGIQNLPTSGAGSGDSQSIPTGRYICLSSSFASPPFGSVDVYLDVHRGGASQAVQVAHVFGGAPRMASRNYSSGVWSAWNEIWGTVNTSANVQSVLRAANNAEIRSSINSSLLPAYTLGTVPVVSFFPNLLIVITDLSGGREPCFSDGTNWRRCSDRSIAS